MPGDLILKSLEIHQFRGLRELKIERLARVNLIVGKNNVGKTTLLEAFALYAQPGSLNDLLDFLASRDEMHPVEIDAQDLKSSYPIPGDRLFHGRKGATGEEGSISIGPVEDSAATLYVGLEARQRVVRASDPSRILIHEDGSRTDLNSYEDAEKFLYRDRGLRVRLGSAVRFFKVEDSLLYRLGPESGSVASTPEPWAANAEPFRLIPHFMVGPNGLDLSVMGRLWDNISLSSHEQDVTGALRILAPDVERVALKEREEGPRRAASSPHEKVRIPFVKSSTFEEPIPLRTMGDGVIRMFGIALALVNARGGFLLIDEIKNGIHYSVQADLWRMIFRVAPKLGVQVFSTTHSYDCIRAFEEAARESPEEGVLIRLAQRAGKLLAGEFDEEDLAIAVEGRIEVR